MKWIDAKKQKPVIGLKVLVAALDDSKAWYYWGAEWDGRRWITDAWDEYGDSDEYITHWMDGLKLDPPTEGKK